MVILGLLLIWFGRSTLEVWRDYRTRLAIEQAYADVRLLELVRRTHSGGGLNHSDSSKADLINDFAELAPLLQNLGAIGELDDVQQEASKYSLNHSSVQVSLQLKSDSNVEYQYPGADSNYQAGTVETPHLLNLDVYYRESDPLIFNYIVGSVERKNL